MRALGKRARNRIYADHRAGRMIRLAPGVFVAKSEWHELKRPARAMFQAAAAQVSLPGSVITGQTGALINGLHLHVSDREITVDILLPQNIRARDRPDVRIFTAPASAGDIGGQAGYLEIGGHRVAVLDPTQCALDAARLDGFLHSLVPLEHALHLGLANPESISTALGRRLLTRGIARARRVASLAGPWSESPQETRLRVRLRELGLRPVQQAEIYDECGVLLGRADFLFPDSGLVVEYEGAAKTAGPAGGQRATHELERARLLTNAGLTLRHVDAAAFRRGQTFTEIVDLHRRLAGRGLALDPSRWSLPPSMKEWAAGLRYRYGRDRHFTRVRPGEGGRFYADVPRLPYDRRRDYMDSFPEEFPGYQPTVDGFVPDLRRGRRRGQRDPWFPG